MKGEKLFQNIDRKKDKRFMVLPKGLHWVTFIKFSIME